LPAGGLPPEATHRHSGNRLGVGVSPGFATGPVYILSRRNPLFASMLENPLPPEEEHQRLRLAIEKARIQTLYMEKRVAERLSDEDAAIFHSHLMILEDRGFISKIETLINQGYGAARAVHEVVQFYMDAFERMDDPYLRSRSADMDDIGRRIIDSLDGNEQELLSFSEKRILVATEILPSDLATIEIENILGIVTEKGDLNSHAAIIARSLGIPAIVGIEGLIRELSRNDRLIVDGNSGHIFINPDSQITKEYERLKSDFSSKRRELDGLCDVKAITRDGVRISLKANIGLISDIRIAVMSGAEGVGLYRTEFPFMARKQFPDRNEQAAIYSKILEGFEGKQVTIRTLDIGGDKGLPYFAHPHEDNPFMGWRGIRISLECRDIFREQLAAIMLAAVNRDVRIMLPMISGVDEIIQTREIYAEVAADLRTAGIAFNETIPLGVMIETPAAVQTAAILAKNADFFSIGTNDLIQYTLAADRNNPKVKRYYTPYHPALLHSIKAVAAAARNAGIPVSLCGEMAADPLNALLLAGLGITDLSMSSPSIPKVKQAIIGATLKAAEQLAGEILKLESSAAIASFLKESSLELGIVS